MWKMADAAQKAGHLSLSYAVKGEGSDLEGYDGVVWMNRHYLNTIAPAVGAPGSAEALLQATAHPVDREDLPLSVKAYLTEQYSLLNRMGRNLDGFNEHASLFRYAGSHALPVLSQNRGEMDRLTSPLIVLVDDPPSAFNDQNLAALMTSGNASFDDASWVRDYLAAHPIGVKVLSVDRISDSALYNSQLQNQSAWMKTLSFALVLLALVMSIAISAMVHALSTSRRIFAQRTAGWSWSQALRGRLVWEGLVVLVIGIGTFIALGSGAKLDAWWILASIPLYMTISTALHLRFARGIFANTVARKA
jgi:hypothetical protein